MGALRTPDGPQGSLCWPPVSEWQGLVEQNRMGVAAWQFDVEGVPGTELRTAARRSVLAFAGVKDAGKRLNNPLIVTGHQPQFYHPGIWMKAFVVTAAVARQGGYGLNLAVDHDAGELAAEIPWRDESGLHVAKQYLVQPRPGRPLETLPPPTVEQVDGFIAAVDERLATLGDVRPLLWQTFADGLRAVVSGSGAALGDETGGVRGVVAPARNAAEVGWRSRAMYERALGYELIPDVPVSRISGTREFLLFFVHWVVNASKLREAYNQALFEFRTRHGVRSAGNPFPDLLVRPDGAVELPFWGLTKDGIRRKLYAERAGADLVLTNLEGVFARLPAVGGEEAVNALLDAGVAIRPRAVPLTVFHRLFVADLFVHGTGGARYDEVTDALIRTYFGVEPPRYAVVSATMHVPLGETPVQPSAVRSLQHKLRDLVWNPQRYAWEAAGADEATDAQLAALLREKERLITEIERAQAERSRSGSEVGPVGGSMKRDLTRAIEATNARLYGLLADVVRTTEEQLAALMAAARSGSAATRRTYPFFLHDPAHMQALPNGAVDGAVDEVHSDDNTYTDDATVACCGAEC